MDQTKQTESCYCLKKDLGIMVDHEFTFEQHIRSKLKKINVIMEPIRCSFKFLDQQLFRKLFIVLRIRSSGVGDTPSKVCEHA